ncbi:MAG: restriction endonuclease subunit R, partial [Bacteroidota bacterium]|nr:restriction endonuclease subunit R [Bacteroidota bacterium]
MEELNQEILKAEEELKLLNERQKELIEKILWLKKQKDFVSKPLIVSDDQNETINNYSSEKAKIDLFRSLFKGREDVFPKRFENSKTGKSGYQPTCSNEWIHGVCEKPRIKCSDCQRQSFIP